MKNRSQHVNLILSKSKLSDIVSLIITVLTGVVDLQSEVTVDAGCPSTTLLDITFGELLTPDILVLVVSDFGVVTSKKILEEDILDK
ncbi:hypothetical protein BLOT_015614 [Blomia tropicalis]|nr:hypothetical protein BLOT_015614 [Blomia tropicalis]